MGQGSLKFDWIFLYGFNKIGADKYGEKDIWEDSRKNKIADRWWGVLNINIETFEAGVSWTSTTGEEKKCKIIGLSNCTFNGGPLVNTLNIEFDNSFILYPFKQIHLNEWKEHEPAKTLEFKTYMAPDCEGLTKKERAIITDGIDKIMMSESLRKLIIVELRREFMEWTLELIRRTFKEPNLEARP